MATAEIEALFLAQGDMDAATAKRIEELAAKSPVALPEDFLAYLRATKGEERQFAGGNLIIFGIDEVLRRLAEFEEPPEGPPLGPMLIVGGDGMDYVYALHEGRKGLHVVLVDPAGPEILGKEAGSIKDFVLKSERRYRREHHRAPLPALPMRRSPDKPGEIARVPIHEDTRYTSPIGIVMGDLFVHALTNTEHAIAIWDYRQARKIAEFPTPGGIHGPTYIHGENAGTILAHYWMDKAPDGVIIRIDPASGRELERLPGFSSSVVFDDIHAVTADKSRLVVWDRKTHAELWSYETEDRYICDMALSPRGRCTASNPTLHFSSVTDLLVYDLDQRTVWRRSIENLSEPVFIDESRMALAAMESLKIWDFRNDRMLFEVPMEKRDPAGAVACLPDGRLVVGHPAAMTIHDGTTGRELCRFKFKAKQGPSRLFPAPDGRHVISAGFWDYRPMRWLGSTARVWRLPD